MKHNSKNFFVLEFCLLPAACCLLLAVTGCAMIPTIQRKFTRKTYHPPPPVAIATKDYDMRLPPQERYQRHYAMWSFWHGELLDSLGGNSKRALRAADEEIAELQTLQTMLAPAKRDQLGAHVERLQHLRQELDNGTISQATLFRWRSELELQQRTMHHEFAWKHAQESIVVPEETTPPAAVPPAAPEQ